MKKLNAKGISHLLIPIVVVVVVAAIGTFMLVSSHADPMASASSTGLVLMSGGQAKTKSVISSGGKAHTVTDLETVVSCKNRNTCSKISYVTIGGHKAKRAFCELDCVFDLRVNGNHVGETFKTKVYAGGRVKESQNIRYN